MTNESTAEPILSVRDLKVRFKTEDGMVNAVNGVSYDLQPGETLGIVGESGSGKSVGVMALLGLLPSPPAQIEGGEAWFEGENVLKASKSRLRKIRGSGMSMIFQDPMTTLNPVMKVGKQIMEGLLVHNDDMNKKAAHDRATELLDLVGVPNAKVRVDQYPHEYSGGMRQRAMIALAIANNPRVLIADEPTTALDVTIQAQVLEVLKTAQRETNAGMIMITHDLGVIAEVADRIAVMYAGRIVEMGSPQVIFKNPQHPYTLGLIGSLPRLDARLKKLMTIGGLPPDLARLPQGCAYAPRCSLRRDRDECVEERPALREVLDDHFAACHFNEEMEAEQIRVSEQVGFELTEAAEAAD
jgi:oligopeptide/dipeptide ABC transporter ATP-binding protein